MTNPNQQPLITHVPTQEDFAAVDDLDMHHDLNNALRPEQVGTIRRAMGHDVLVGIAPEGAREPIPQRRPIVEPELEEGPYIAPEGEQTYRGTDLQRIREQAQQILDEEQPRETIVSDITR
jgi:hypothetical protein